MDQKNEKILAEREAKKRGRRCTAISIRCTKEELPKRIDDLKLKGFELDDDFPERESFDSAGPAQHIVVLHGHESYDELVSFSDITAETRCF